MADSERPSDPTAATEGLKKALDVITGGDRPDGTPTDTAPAKETPAADAVVPGPPKL